MERPDGTLVHGRAGRVGGATVSLTDPDDGGGPDAARGRPGELSIRFAPRAPPGADEREWRAPNPGRDDVNYWMSLILEVAQEVAPEDSPVIVGGLSGVVDGDGIPETVMVQGAYGAVPRAVWEVRLKYRFRSAVTTSMDAFERVNVWQRFAARRVEVFVGG
eukprot:Hpha_TRINITY_DN18934_c0_g1::TRINITY_DN18934_c0_g1_i1::g.17478::m.17478